MAGSIFQYFPSDRVWWVIITTLYQLIPQSWYQKTAQSLVNKLLKANIKGVFTRSYCCYGNLLSHKIDSNLFTNNWAVFWYHDCGINWYRVVIMTHQTLSRKVLETVSSHLKYMPDFTKEHSILFEWTFKETFDPLKDWGLHFIVSLRGRKNPSSVKLNVHTRMDSW